MLVAVAPFLARWISAMSAIGGWTNPHPYWGWVWPGAVGFATAVLGVLTLVPRTGPKVTGFTPWAGWCPVWPSACAVLTVSQGRRVNALARSLDLHWATYAANRGLCRRNKWGRLRPPKLITMYADEAGLIVELRMTGGGTAADVQRAADELSSDWGAVRVEVLPREEGEPANYVVLKVVFWSPLTGVRRAEVAAKEWV
jgi:hypothetical protein